MTRALVVAVCMVGFGVGASTLELPLDRRALEEALAIGQARVEPIRARFHASYRVVVGSAPLDYIEIVTPFRSVVLAAEARARAGDRTFGLREAQQVVAATSDELALYVELTFHPHNTFVGVPPYDVVLSARDAVIQPFALERIPRFGPRVDGYPLPTVQSPGGLILGGGSQPLTGGTLIARFHVSQLDPRGASDVLVKEGATTLSRARIDPGRVR